MSAVPRVITDFGDGYDRARTGAGFSAGMFGLLWATGPDTVSFLQGILSQDIERLAPGDVARSFLLEPRGKLNSLLWVLRDADRVGIVTDASRHEETVSSLSRWRFRVDVDFVPDRRPVLDVWGPREAGLEVPGGWIDRQGVLVAELLRRPVRRRLIAGVDPADMRERGVVPIGRQVVDAFRIESGGPRMGVDVDERTMPQETGLVPEAISFTKGCFLGQELAARIDSRGRVNRHLRGLRMLDSVAPPAGARLTHAGKQVGQLTTVAESPAMLAPVGLALVRREATPGTRVAVTWEGGRTEAEVHELPMTGPPR